MELITYLIDVLASDPKVILLLVGLLFVSLAGIIVHLPGSKVEITNDKYTPKRSINSINHERYNKNNWQ